MSRKHHLFINEQKSNKFHLLMEYKIPKPFFLEMIKITLGNPVNNTYIMLKNIIYRGKQILVLKQEEDSTTIILVEAQIENGKLAYISKLSDATVKEISTILETTIH